mmetsp:Transcript_39289/g.98364  ORF Transcript_39289/g.98364 Transcript_39289/m.98364 type:complete len:193 (+) Transcript_39289:37-615(+)|eukprot:CAMPEP_0173426070 /NCGR_PEP_ID=MMETSP1357-20121228/5631_1 /TAXON_ID=77926 /ORGANISM="Hemiselmis rufescens, Strain PCC563" /LENGTH=192 /DNA_ID=CAMNT_0014389647 /DNA_START=26 /DNA_END=604 /DNA_ORIENTATION=+
MKSQRVPGAERGEMDRFFLVGCVLLALMPCASSLSCYVSPASGTGAAVSTNCSSSVQYCYTISPSLNSSTVKGQDCFANATGALSCPVSGGGSKLYSTVSGVNYTFTCCNTTNCNTASTASANETAADEVVKTNETSGEARPWGHAGFVPEVPLGSFGIATYVILSLVASVGFVGGLMVDLAAKEWWPFAES